MPKKPEKERERDQSHTTAHEIRYIRHQMGKEGSIHSLAVRKATRIRLLKNYIRSCYYKNWPKEIDGNKCLNVATEELDKAQRGR